MTEFRVYGTDDTLEINPATIRAIEEAMSRQTHIIICGGFEFATYDNPKDLLGDKFMAGLADIGANRWINPAYISAVHRHNGDGWLRVWLYGSHRPIDLFPGKRPLKEAYTFLKAALRGKYTLPAYTKMERCE